MDIRKTLLIEKLIDDYYSALYGHLYKRLKSSELVKDILQEVFLKLCQMPHEKLEDLAPRFQGYIFTMAGNKMIDFLRKDKKKAQKFTDRVCKSLGYKPDFLPKLEYEYLIKILRKELKNHEIQIIILKLEGYKAKEVGELFGTSENNIHAILSRTRKKVIKIIEDIYAK